MARATFNSSWDDGAIIVSSNAEVDLNNMTGKIFDYCTEEDRLYGEGDGVEELDILDNEYFQVGNKKYIACPGPEWEEMNDKEHEEFYDPYGNGVITFDPWA